MTQVPSVDCGIVLKKVPELLCVPEVYEDCNDVAIQVPYIAPGRLFYLKQKIQKIQHSFWLLKSFIFTEEKCEELLFDECVEVYQLLKWAKSKSTVWKVVQRIPVEVCRRTILDEERIFLSKGPMFRSPPKSRGPRENPEINLSDWYHTKPWWYW